MILKMADFYRKKVSLHFCIQVKRMEFSSQRSLKLSKPHNFNDDSLKKGNSNDHRWQALSEVVFCCLRSKSCSRRIHLQRQIPTSLVHSLFLFLPFTLLAGDISVLGFFFVYVYTDARIIPLILSLVLGIQIHAQSSISHHTKI